MKQKRKRKKKREDFSFCLVFYFGLGIGLFGACRGCVDTIKQTEITGKTIYTEKPSGEYINQIIKKYCLSKEEAYQKAKKQLEEVNRRLNYDVLALSFGTITSLSALIYKSWLETKSKKRTKLIN